MSGSPVVVGGLIGADKTNYISTISRTGTQMASESYGEGRLIYCTQTGSGYTQGLLYLATNKGLFPVNSVDLLQTYLTNSLNVDLHNIIFEDQAWIKTSADTGSSITNEVLNTVRTKKLTSGTTAGSSASIYIEDLCLDFAKYMLHAAIFKINNKDDLTFRLGPGGENVNAANTNAKKFGAEFCRDTSQGTPAVDLQIFSANGSARTMTPATPAPSTFYAVASNTRISCLQQYLVTELWTYINDSVQLQKTTEMPGSGTVTNVAEKQYRASIKARLGSASRIMNISYLRLAGQVYVTNY